MNDEYVQEAQKELELLEKREYFIWNCYLTLLPILYYLRVFLTLYKKMCTEDVKFSLIQIRKIHILVYGGVLDLTVKSNSLN